METDRTLIASSSQVEERRTALGSQPSGLGRHSVDPAHGSDLAGLAGSISQPFDLLATAPVVGGRRCLAGDLAGLPLHAGRTQTTRLERSLCGWHVRTGQKRGPGVGTPALAGGARETKRGKAQSAWWWSTAKVFLWESTWRRLPRRK